MLGAVIVGRLRPVLLTLVKLGDGVEIPVLSDGVETLVLGVRTAVRLRLVLVKVGNVVELPSRPKELIDAETQRISEQP